MAMIHTQLLSQIEENGEPHKNCAAAGITFFQMFSSTSALLGLSRSSDYSAVNANLNALIGWRRTFGCCGQSNMWGMVAGTGLAGHGSGAAGRHGDTSKGAGGAAGETVETRPSSKAPAAAAPAPDGDFPPEYHQRTPASATFAVAHREANSPVELQHKVSLAGGDADGLSPVRGLSVSLRTKDSDDKVLLVCNLPTSSRDNHDGVSWALKRGSQRIGPLFTSWTHELARLENVLMPWLDTPGKAKLDCEYTVGYRMKGSVQISREQERRQLTAIAVPGAQVTSSQSREALAVHPGKWHDVPGLQQISYTNKGEKVLVICTVRYTALWADEMARGRFTIFRDGVSLDPEHYGLQSVRALQKGVKRTLVIALVDAPKPGPHLYQVRAAVTSMNDEPRVLHIDEDERQLALIRLPGETVVGPSRCQGMATVNEDRWTEIPGLSLTVTLQNPHDKVLLVYNSNFNPTGLNYEAYFTLFRHSESSSMKNLGHEDQGMWCVASSAAGSSEYPVAMFTDSPGAGTYTYSVHARTRRCDHLTEAPPVEVGPDGQIAAVVIESKRSGTNLADMMSKEIDEARPAEQDSKAGSPTAG